MSGARKPVGLLTINNYRKKIWTDSEGKVCWQTILTGLSGPCAIRTNERLIFTRVEQKSKKHSHDSSKEHPMNS